ncbi:hypothetical protein CMI37_33210 [Candidatus Pacearchaeota archaeon]|nr:hypothetical protein [Candidatus Pacearchaeota archaeon]|tara:strand:- start:1815 stop:2243 length:429 start_codon:yes stop_codon:yes gene_type:complete
MQSIRPDLTLTAHSVRGDEPCLRLSEENIVGLKPGGGVRRVQIILVVRNDRVWEYRKDMGRANKFRAPEFAFPGAVPLSNGRWDVIETVQRLKHAAEDVHAYGIPTEEQEPTDLTKGFEEYATRRRDARVGRKQIAMPGGVS